MKKGWATGIFACLVPVSSACPKEHPGTPQNTHEETMNVQTIRLTVPGHILTVTLEQNSSTAALLEGEMVLRDAYHVLPNGLTQCVRRYQ